MPFLRTRLERLLGDLKSGKTVLADEVLRGLQPDLYRVGYLPDGTLDLETCSPRLRSVARAYYLAAAHVDDGGEASGPVVAPPQPIDSTRVRDLNRTLFAHYSEVFRSFTGCLPENFVPEGSDFATQIQRIGARLASDPRIAEALHRAADEATQALGKHYASSRNERLHAGVGLPGQKFVLGGTQSFTSSSLRAVQSMLLYADTVLIPDPVQRWTEADPVAEAFPTIRMLEDIYHISKLRPLVEADLPTVPLLVFPSWEKLMEEHDVATKEGMERMFLSVLSPALGATLEDLEEAMSYARRKPDEFLRRINERNLFVPFGDDVGDDKAGAVARQRDEWAQMRSKVFMDVVDRMNDAEVALMTILERLGPQFHALDNANALRASPLFSLAIQWHYFKATYEACSGAMEKTGAISARTLGLVRAMSERNVHWLGRVPIGDLVRLRKEMANLAFRKSLAGILSEFDDGSVSNMDSALANAAIAIDKLLADHDVEARKIDEEYRRRHAQTMTVLVMSIGAAFTPFVPIVGSVAAAGAIAKMAADEVDRRLKHHDLSRTMMGLLAASARNK